LALAGKNKELRLFHDLPPGGESCSNFRPQQFGGGLGKGQAGAERFFVTRFAYRLSGLRHFAGN
jgi:hypothetical protein